MTILSVNINKIATIINARGGNLPNVSQFAVDCEAFGADGITVHPRPDERHITFKSCTDKNSIRKVVKEVTKYHRKEDSKVTILY